MTLTGSITTMSLPDVLDWIDATSRDGVLAVRGVGCETMLRCQRGHIAECTTSDPPALLGQYLLFYGLIDEPVLDQAMRAHRADKRKLGEILLEMGALGDDSLTDALRAKAKDTVLGIFDRPTGWFTFDPSFTSLESAQPVDMPIRDVLVHGGVRVRDASIAAAVIKRPASVLRKTSKPPSAKLSSVWPLRCAYALVDGERNVDEIALHMHGTDFHVTQRLHQLVLEGFIEVAERAQAMASSDAQHDAEDPAAIAEWNTGVDSFPDEPAGVLERIAPDSLSPELVEESLKLTTVERYLLTLCDGTRDLQRIKVIAPVQPQLVTRTLHSLRSRGWLKERPAVLGHEQLLRRLP